MKPSELIKALPYAIICIALVLTIEHWIIPDWIESQSSELHPWNRVYARKVEIQKPQQYDVIALGDSTSVQSLQPALFTQVTQQTMYNYGTYASSTWNDLYFADQYLRQHPAPKAFIVVKSPYFWSNEMERKSFVNTFQDAGLLGWNLGTKGMLSPGQVYKSLLTEFVFPSLYNRFEIREIQRAKKEIGVVYQNNAQRRESPGELGFEPFNTQFHKTHSSAEDEKNWQHLREKFIDEDGNFSIHESEKAGLLALCDIAKRHNVPMYITTGPVHRIFHTNTEISGVFRSFEEQLSDIVTSTDHCTYWNTISLPENQLSDFTHAYRDGVNVYSQFIALNYMRAKR